jgi:hypothetical protein
MRVSPSQETPPAVFPTESFKPAPYAPKDTISQSSSSSYFGSIIDGIARLFKWLFCCGEALPPPPPGGMSRGGLSTEFEQFCGILNSPRLALFNNNSNYLQWPMDRTNPLDTIILENLQERDLDLRVGEGLLHKLCRYEGKWGFDPFNFIITHPMIAHLVNERDVDAAILDTNRRTALHFAQSKETVELLEGKISFDARDAEGNSALHVAANKEVAQALIAGGAIPIPINEKGETPLHLVRDRNLCLFFIDVCGIDLAQEDFSGVTPLDRVQSVEIADAMWEKGADASRVSTKTGDLPLHFAANADLVTFFHEKYPDGLETLNQTGNTPLAAQLSRLANLKDGNPTPLQQAVTQLIELGASLDIRVNSKPLLDFLLENYEEFFFEIIKGHAEAFPISTSPSAMKLMLEQARKSLGDGELLVYQDEYFDAIDFLLEQRAPLTGDIGSHSLPQFCLNVADKLVRQQHGGQDEWRKMAFRLALIQGNEAMAVSILEGGYPLPDVILGGLGPKEYCEQNGLPAIAPRL